MNWSFKNSNIFICYSTLVLIICFLLFNEKAAGIEFFLCNYLILFITFSLIPYFVNKYNYVESNIFEKRVFVLSFILQIVYSIIINAIFYSVTNSLFSVDARDALFYHRYGLQFAQNFRNSSSILISGFPLLTDDLGFPIFLGTIYYLFNDSIVIFRVVNCLLGSISVILIYRISKLLWEDRISKLAAILFTLSPLMMFYSSTHEKETTLVFLILLISYCILGNIKNNRIWPNILIIIIILVLLLHFRFIVPIIVIGALLITLVFNLFKTMKLLFTISIIIVILLGSYFIILQFELHYFLLNRLESAYYGGGRSIEYMIAVNSFAKFATTPILALISFPAPFPNLVQANIKFFNQTDQWYQASGIIFWNLISFFSLFGIYYCIKNKATNTYYIISFTIIYMFTLALSNYATSIRFQYVALPFKIILASYGYHYVKDKKHLWHISLIFIVIFIIVWNYIKLAGRDLI